MVIDLAYDVGKGKILKINKQEAEEVKEIFFRYLYVKSSPKVVQSLNEDGYTTIDWETQKKKRLNNQHPIDTDTYKKILKHFINKWENGDTDERKDIAKTMVRTVISNVGRDNKGTIEIKYIADKKLEAEWTEIKKCESGSVNSLPVRTIGLSGSPGRILPRTHRDSFGMMPSAEPTLRSNSYRNGVTAPECSGLCLTDNPQF